jgi:hypothetical protein
MSQDRSEKDLAQDIAAVVAGKKVVFVDVYVHKALSEDVYIVGDNSTTVKLDLTSKPEFTKDVSVGKCYRLPRPAIQHNSLVLSERFGPCWELPRSVFWIRKVII